MPTVSIRDLANGASRVVDAVNSSGRPALVTNRGRPVAAIVPIPEEALEDWVLANAPEYLANMAEAEEEIAAGTKGVPFEEAFAALQEGPQALDALIARAENSSPAGTKIPAGKKVPAPQGERVLAGPGVAKTSAALKRASSGAAVKKRAAAGVGVRKGKG